MDIPIIGITLDHEEPGSYSKFPWYAARVNYASAVARAGGLPVFLPYQMTLVDKYLDTIDGLIITGGNFDVDPSLFGADHRHAAVKTKEARTEFEAALTKGALQRGGPVLGICGGMQLLNVLLGGTLIQHIPDQVENALAHEQPGPRDETSHDVIIKEDTLLHRIIGGRGGNTIAVNSAHHQAAGDVPATAVVNATAPDGVIEGIEAPDYFFCLGVQWHPEFELTDADVRIFAAFVEAARRYAKPE
ncbi:MAG: gamma-glutamyl-gamma-aminobutyrate hydrolase family protein [Rhodospirillales bacterium]|nr:gamma-glutamyl-gamma-aminobutyrate hydrolase family protein [Rhodospirillales bacterium]